MASSQTRRSSQCDIYINGRIYTVAGSDWDTRPEEAMVVQNGVIVYVGSNEEAEGFYKSGI